MDSISVLGVDYYKCDCAATERVLLPISGYGMVATLPCPLVILASSAARYRARCLGGHRYVSGRRARKIGVIPLVLVTRSASVPAFRARRQRTERPCAELGLLGLAAWYLE